MTLPKLSPLSVSLSASLSVSLSAVLFAAACGASSKEAGAQLQQYQARDQRVTKQLATFDDLDFNVFSDQKWDELSHSHAQNITVHWPDGHITEGLDVHIADLKKLFVYAPDTRIKEHPIKLGDGEWTAVYGTMEGTFTLPMPLPNGTSIPPNGKAFKLPMATIGHWNAEGVMTEEYLFWDNATYMAQLGLGG